MQLQRSNVTKLDNKNNV